MQNCKIVRKRDYNLSILSLGDILLKKICCVCFVVLNVWAFDFKPIVGEIDELDEKFVYMKDNPQIQIGASGIIIKQIKNASSIVSRASVVGRERGLIKLALKPFTMLEQRALPVLDVKVQKGDEVVVNFLYDRILLIAPDEKSYRLVESNYPELYFMHPDILGAYMVREFKLSPKKNDFNLFCSNNALGIVAFVLETKVSFVDCQDFTLLFEKPLNAKVAKPQTPFYSNIKGYKKNVFNFTESRIKDYYEYYKEMIRQEK